MYQIVELEIKEENEKTIHISKEIAENEYKKLKDYNQSIREITGKLQQFIQLEDAYTEYLSKIENEKYDSDNIIRAVDNYLSSYKGFLDRSEAYLKRNESEEMYTYFKSLIREVYDNNFEYRFIYNLRNYSQHVSNPISSITSSMDKKRTILINKQSFINYHSRIQGPFKKELNNIQEKEIDINNAIMVVHKKLQHVQEKILNEYIQSTEDILRASYYIKGFYEKYSEYKGALAIASQESIKAIIEMSEKGGNTTLNPYILEYNWAMRILESSKIILKIKGINCGKSEGFPRVLKTQNALEIPKFYSGSQYVNYDGVRWVKLVEEKVWEDKNGYDSLSTIYMPQGLNNRVYKQNISDFRNTLL